MFMTARAVDPPLVTGMLGETTLLQGPSGSLPRSKGNEMKFHVQFHYDDSPTSATDALSLEHLADYFSEEERGFGMEKEEMLLMLENMGLGWKQKIRNDEDPRLFAEISRVE
jgi:hypothetical protein